MSSGLKGERTTSSYESSTVLSFLQLRCPVEPLLLHSSGVDTYPRQSRQIPWSHLSSESVDIACDRLLALKRNRISKRTSLPTLAILCAGQIVQDVGRSKASRTPGKGEQALQRAVGEPAPAKVISAASSDKVDAI